jgi:hypothetical protein
MSDNDVVGLHRAVVALVTDDEARQSWLCDPEAFTAPRVEGPAAGALSRIDAIGLQAFTLSHVAKKDRFDYLHKLHHELEDRKASERAAKEGSDHDHLHGHSHDHPHEHGHSHGAPV